MKTLRVGCASGFWGDTREGARQLVERGSIDYLVFDHLAEITMALLARIKAKKPEAGFVPDLIETVAPLLPEIMKRGIKVVANGGGINPQAAADALKARAEALGVNPRIAVVVGDDVLPLTAHGELTDMFTGQPVPQRLTSANAYLGARPIAQALALGADIVITGRCVDSAVLLGPAIHEFDIAAEDDDRLSAMSLAGHLVECGTQVTGGIFTDWQDVPGWEEMGFPIAVLRDDGSFDITKSEKTGGLVSPLSVAEQMLYEIDDPAHYRLPDVVCDWRDVTLTQTGPDVVTVQGCKGRAPTGLLKVSATALDGFRVMSTITIIGRDAARKAQRTGEAILARARHLMRARGFDDFTETSIEIIGAGTVYGDDARASTARDVVLKIGARHPDEKALNILAAEIVPAATAMAQGLTGFFAGRPNVAPVFRGYSFLIPADAVSPIILFEGREYAVPPLAPRPTHAVEAKPALQSDRSGTIAVPLIKLAVGRSGDKGNNANIGIIARKPAYLPFIKAALTADAVKQFFAVTGVTHVDAFELPGIAALNFVLHDSLGGGGIVSLRIDPQGKGFAQMVMDFPVPVPPALAQELNG
ncbi:DUF1446 domain-containing protein [Rhizobiales bacterium TNE-4]|nr:DUF1446 domain-containing protein [Rhizobiales bacterium TNE-4]MBV1827329.1 DUF1446 domain-containing protein [Rhizobiales bacterium TNE-4]